MYQYAFNVSQKLIKSAEGSLNCSSVSTLHSLTWLAIRAQKTLKFQHTLRASKSSVLLAQSFPSLV